jgi:hypothetical protein
LRLTLRLAPLDPDLVSDHQKLMFSIAKGDSAKAREISLHRLELLEGCVLDTLLESEDVQGVNVEVLANDR